MTLEKQKNFYIPELDGLRFFAFLLIFFHNADPVLSNSFLRKVSEYGWIGVDLFFCLSAYLITRLLVIEYQSTNQINIKHFYIRRILRIWPLYYFYIFIGLIYAYLVPHTLEKVFLNLFSLLTFSYNFAYFFLFPIPIVIFIHLWSISYEIQYYTISPWIVNKLMKISTTAKWFVLISILFFSNVIRAIFIYNKIVHPVIYFLPLTHLDSIITGIILGTGILDKFISQTNGYKILIAGLALIFCVFQLPNNQIIGWHLPITYFLSACGMLLIIMSTLVPTKSATNIFSSRIFVFLGRISYGLYIFHFLGLSLTVQIFIKYFKIAYNNFDENFLSFISLAFLITLAFSFLSYRLIELPFLKLKNNFS